MADPQCPSRPHGRIRVEGVRWCGLQRTPGVNGPQSGSTGAGLGHARPGAALGRPRVGRSNPRRQQRGPDPATTGSARPDAAMGRAEVGRTAPRRAQCAWPTRSAGPGLATDGSAQPAAGQTGSGGSHPEQHPSPPRYAVEAGDDDPGRSTGRQRVANSAITGRQRPSTGREPGTESGSENGRRRNSSRPASSWNSRPG